jgi:hypothetical protein
VKRIFLQISPNRPSSQPIRPFGPPGHLLPPPDQPEQAAAGGRPHTAHLPRHGETSTTEPPLYATLTPPPPLPSLPVMATMKAPITTTTSPIPATPDPIKGHPRSGGAPHPFTSPPPLLIRTHAIAAWS